MFESIPSKGEVLVAALEAGVITRRWSCGSDKAECTPEDSDQRGYLHYSCRWYWSMWTVVQQDIEQLYQETIFEPEEE